jgi:hypothetical protein
MGGHLAAVEALQPPGLVVLQAGEIAEGSVYVCSLKKHITIKALAKVSYFVILNEVKDLKLL